MPLELLVAPAAEPVSLAEAKAQLRLETTDEDAFVTSLIVTSRLHVEVALGLALIAQSWRLVLDRWPGAGWSVELPLRPVAAISEVRIYDASGAVRLIEPDDYVLDGRAGRLDATVTPFAPPGRRRRGIEIDIEAGFGALGSDVPAPIRQALLLLVAHWFENREPAAFGTTAVRIPDAVSELLAPWRKVML